MKIELLTKDIKYYTDTIFFLKKEGWQVVFVTDRQQMISNYTSQFYDAIVIDTSTFDDWRKTIEDIRNKQVFTPILLITNRKDVAARIAGMEMGADMCLSKPFNKKEFMIRIKVLNRRNTYYQTPTISFSGITLNRPDGKICHGDTSLSVCR